MRSRGYVNKSSNPKSKVDACVECDLPFDKSKIAPELRRKQTREETEPKVSETRPEEVVSPNQTNLGGWFSESPLFVIVHTLN